VSTGVPEAQIINSILEGLINYHPVNDNLPEPGVASSWEHNEDYSTWTFHLRPDARWSNGDTVTAHDFVYSFKRMLDRSSWANTRRCFSSSRTGKPTRWAS
jgi:oligopeptide transport system substrate-binding protein